MYCFFAYVQNGFTPFHMACQEGHRDIVSLLLKHGADLQAVNKVRKCWQCFQTTVCDKFKGPCIPHACVVVNQGPDVCHGKRTCPLGATRA